MSAPLESCLYVGTVRHRRHEPAENKFSYKLFMMYLDLAELPRVFEPYLFWSAKRAAPARFDRDDYLHDEDRSLSLDESVRRLVTRETGKRPTGPIRLLTHLRYFGYSFNPVTFYYCFDATGTAVQTIVAEITNTPWKERHAYVLPVSASAGSSGAWHFRFGKQFHVSPFMPMDMRYDWRFSAPSDGLHVHMENWAHSDNGRNGRPVFDATLSLRRERISSASLARALVGFPMMTAQVITLIHWQALRLWARRVPFITHPKKLAPTVHRGTLPP